MVDRTKGFRKIKGARGILLKTKEPMMILAGDVGGTKSRFGLFSVSKDNYHLLSEKTFPSQHYKGLEIIVKELLGGEKKIVSACFGVAGPVIEGKTKATNLPWVIHTKSLQKELGIKKVGLINDLVANGYGIPLLKKGDFETLNAGKERRGNAALISAGTGLGEAILFWSGKEHIPLPSEGGHAEFAPRNLLEIELLQYLMYRSSHVSYERILSGAGLSHLYRSLSDSKRFGREPERLEIFLSSSWPLGASISEGGSHRRSSGN